MSLIFKVKPFNEFSLDELYEVLQLRTEIFVVEQNCPYQECDGKDKASFHLLGFMDKKLVAYARLLPVGVSYENYCSIGRVLVKNGFRNHSYAKDLMKYAIDYCETVFECAIKISAQEYLKEFYIQLGFQEISLPYLEDNIPHISMIKE